MPKRPNRPRRTSPLRLTPALELFEKSRDLVLKNIWIFGPLYAIPLIFNIHSWMWTPRDKVNSFWDNLHWFNGGFNGSVIPVRGTAIFIGFSLAWLLFVLVVGTVASIMTQAASLQAVQSDRPDFRKLWSIVKKKGWPMFGLYLIVGLTLILGIFLLIIGFFIFLRRYFLAPYVMLDKQLGIKSAMAESSKISKAHVGSVWGVLGVCFLISFIAIIPFVGWLISLVLGMLYSAAPALRYEELKKLASYS